MRITVGIDWAEKHHDVAVLDDAGTVVSRARIETSSVGLTKLLEMIAECGGSPTSTPAANATTSGFLSVPGPPSLPSRPGPSSRPCRTS